MNSATSSGQICGSTTAIRRPPRRNARSSSRRSGASDGSQFSGAKFENTPSTARPRADQPSAICCTLPSRNSIGAWAPRARVRLRARSRDHRRRRVARDHAMATLQQRERVLAGAAADLEQARGWEKCRSTARITRARIIAISGFAADENMSS
jgi:hypothetical protein